MSDPKTQAYLARYVGGPSTKDAEGGARKKRRKQKHTEESGLVIQDDSAWSTAPADDEPEEANGALVLGGGTSQPERKPAFKKAFDPSGSATKQQQSSSEAATESPAPAETPAATSRPRAGLLTKEDIRAQREERKAREAASREAASREAAAAEVATAEAGSSKEQQTVYRDASGRKIDVVAEKAELEAAERKRKAKEQERKTWGRGQVQLDEARRQRAELEEIKSEGVARYANDKKMNAQLRSVVRADDPALAFLSSKSDEAPHGPVMPKYAGPTPPPNRFGIAPGYRWDGVDRSNGFERQYFARINERKRRDQVAQAWRQEDM